MSTEDKLVCILYTAVRLGVPLILAITISYAVVWIIFRKR